MNFGDSCDDHSLRVFATIVPIIRHEHTFVIIAHICQHCASHSNSANAQHANACFFMPYQAATRSVAQIQSERSLTDAVRHPWSESKLLYIGNAMHRSPSGVIQLPPGESAMQRQKRKRKLHKEQKRKEINHNTLVRHHLTSHNSGNSSCKLAHQAERGTKQRQYSIALSWL